MEKNLLETKEIIMSNNIIKLIALIIISIFTYPQSIHAQELDDIKKTQGGYIMDDNVFLRKEMKELFKDSNNSMDLYKKAKRQRVSGHVSLGLGAASSVYGLAVMYGNRPDNRIDNNAPFADLSNNLAEGYFNFGIAMVALGVGLGANSLANYKKSHINYKRALHEYSLSNLKVKDSTEDYIIIETKVTGNGIGLTYSF